MELQGKKESFNKQLAFLISIVHMPLLYFVMFVVIDNNIYYAHCLHINMYKFAAEWVCAALMVSSSLQFIAQSFLLAQVTIGCHFSSITWGGTTLFTCQSVDRN